MNILKVTALKEFHAIAKALDKAHIRWWLEWGTLLGAIREGTVIDGDRDIDISVDFCNSGIAKKVLKAAHLAPPYFVDLWFPERVLLDGEYWLVHYRSGQGWKQAEGRFNVKYMFPFRFYQPLRGIRFLGTDCLIPGQANELLTYIYEDWHTAQKKFDEKSLDYKLYMKRKGRFMRKQDKLIKEVYRQVKGE